MNSQLINEQFPRLTEQQQQQFVALGDLYADWNQKINVISRKDIDNLYPRHVLHSLAIAKYTRFKPGTEILDLGTGGGFPGIPLAILFPEVQFHLIDGTRKKLTVVENVAAAIELGNVHVHHLRAEECKQQFDFVVSRAVATIDKLWNWSYRLIKRKQLNAQPNGLIALKGGRIKEEASHLPKGTYYEIEWLNQYFDQEFFDEKCLIYVQK
ncbi:MAG: 16S rRNA (guanine(527)-N(7))-methyltransferase RsmG [Bacteroidota bacterium]